MQIAAPPQFPGDILRHIARPSFGEVEAENPDWIFVLAVEQIGDHGFEVGHLDIGSRQTRPSRPKSSTTR